VRIAPLEEVLAGLGFEDLGCINWNWSTPALVEAAVRNREGRLAHLGALVVRSGAYTGRAANAKYFVEEPGSRDRIAWGAINKPISPDKFDALLRRMAEYMAGQDVYVQDCLVGADHSYEMAVRIVTEQAWHNLFARNMFLRPVNFNRTLAPNEPELTVIQVPSFEADPARDGIDSEAFVILHLARRLVIIGGTGYAGEIKKSVFTFMNYLLPQSGVLSMHASANVGDEGDVAIFFGLSGTGKTTLSADPARRLIGDDEHGWSDNGVFNLEGGCYAKVIRLSPEKEPEIYETTRRFGTIIENVMMNARDHRLDLHDASITENTRAAYPVTHIPNTLYPGIAGHAQNIVMLTADAFGVMPPIARLNREQAMYYFVSGYTAKLAGTEAGVREPQATFSTCFGAPFMPLHPGVYAELLGSRMERHNVNCWLLNTGWSGGGYGTGERIDIAHTRAMLNAALSGALNDVTYRVDPIFGFEVPESCPGVPAALLRPADSWPDAKAYEAKARELAAAFRANFRNYEDSAPPAVAAAGPGQ